MNKHLATLIEAENEFLTKFGAKCYNAGFEDAMRHIDKIMGWLTMLPDTERQKDQRKWIKNLVLKTYKNLDMIPPEWVKSWK